MMDLDEEGADTIEEILHSISASSHNSSPKELSPHHDLHYKAINLAEDHGASRVGLYSSFSESFSPGIFDEGRSQGISSHLTSPFQTMIAPALAFEPPTPYENPFQFGDIPPSEHGIQKLQTRFESPSKSSFNFQNPTGIFHSSAAETFSSSPNTSPASFHTSSFSSRSFYGDQPIMYSKAIGLPIARSSLRNQPANISCARKVSRHHRDLSGTSTISSLSGPPYDFCPAIDPSALQPPLRKLQTEICDFTKNEVNHIISPFINQVLEHGPDGTITGRYSRPLTSTGRPSHARKTPPGHVKRPRNAFILFRSHACSSNLIPPTVEKDHRQISRIVSHMWKSLPADEKVKWEGEAEAEKELHRKLHPDYRYKPIYRKENSGKKNQGRTNASPPAKKKSTCQKKLKGINFDYTKSRPKDSEKCAPASQKTPDQLQQERDEEIRCEAVAKVLMETKLTGIKLDGEEVEERVLEQVRLVKENHANKSRMKSKSDCQNDQAPPALFPNTKSNTLSISGSQKPKNNILAPLQARRKSLHNRSNSAPPPPSPLRTMHLREVVYNPKARGSRELSPDFPKPRLMAAEEDMKIEDITYPPEDISHAILFPGSFHSELPSEQNYNRLAALSTRNLSYHHYQCDSTPSQELEQLFHSPDLALGDHNCFRSPPDDLSQSLFTPQISEQDNYPLFNGIYAETKSRYRKDPPDQRHWEHFLYQNDHYSSEFCDPLTKLTEDPKATQFSGTSLSNAEEKRSNNSSGEEKMTQHKMGNEHFANASTVRRPSFNIFTPSARRKSSVTMALTECCNPQLIEAIELAKKNMAMFSDQKEKWGNSPNEPGKRRHSVVLSGLGEFPIMDLPHGLAESSQEKAIGDVRMEFDENGDNQSGSAHLSNTNSQGCGGDSFCNFDLPFAARPEVFQSKTINPTGSLKQSDDMTGNNFEDRASNQYGNIACNHDTKEPQVPDESSSGITFESGIGQDGQTYLFLTKEQAETEGLIAQILDAGFGVTYETDLPPEET